MILNSSTVFQFEFDSVKYAKELFMPLLHTTNEQWSLLKDMAPGWRVGCSKSEFTR